MEKIKILKIANKTTKNAKPYKMCEVECGGEIRKVNIWSNFPDFANLQEGSIVMGKMTLDGAYWNIAYEGQEKRPGGQSGAYKSHLIEKAQENKAQYIAKAQNNKEASIKVSSTMRDAVLLTIAEKGDGVLSSEDMQEAIERWRAWLWTHWDKEEKDYPPFNG